jgi:hypothetical protein
MNLFKNQNGDIYAYSDEDFINLARQKYPLRKISDDEIENDFTVEELNTKGHEVITNDYGYTPFSYTPAELAAQDVAKAAALLVNQAKALLRASDYRLIPDEYTELTTDQQTELVAYRAQLRLVARGESTELPTISF